MLMYEGFKRRLSETLGRFRRDKRFIKPLYGAATITNNDHSEIEHNDMHLNKTELGVVQAMLERFQKIEVPRLMDLKDKVDAGEILGDFDLSFLSSMLDELRQSEAFAAHHTEFQHLVSEAISLYHHITETAVKNATPQDPPEP